MNPRMKAARKLIGSSATQWANPNSGDAYWGLAYYEYAGRNIRLWRCPAAKTSDEWREDGLKYGADFLAGCLLRHQWTSSSIMVQNSKRRHQRFSSPKTDPSSIDANQTIIIQDAGEQKMDRWSELITWPPTEAAENLTQWKYSLAPLYPDIDWVSEWFRHGSNKPHGAACETLWADGHASPIRFTKDCGRTPQQGGGPDFMTSIHWYTGLPL